MMENDSFPVMFSPVSFCGHVLVVRCGLKGCSEKCQRLLKSMIHISQTYTAFIITVTLTIKKKKLTEVNLLFTFLKWFLI